MWGQKASLIAGLLENVLFMFATDDECCLKTCCSCLPLMMSVA